MYIYTYIYNIILIQLLIIIITTMIADRATIYLSACCAL